MILPTIDDYQDPRVNQARWLCSDALKDNVTETWVVWGDAVSVVSEGFPNQICYNYTPNCNNYLTM